MIRVKVYRNMDELPTVYENLFAAAGRECVFHSEWWTRCLLDTTCDHGDEIRLYGVENVGDDPETEVRPLGLLVARARTQKLGGLSLRTLSSFSNFYTLRAGPILDPAANDNAMIVQTLIAALRDERPRWELVQFDYLESKTQIFSATLGALRDKGFLAQAHHHHMVWYEDFSRKDFAEYLAARNSYVRKKLTWKNRKMARFERLRYEMVTGDTALNEGISAYQAVYDASWKEPESYPKFVPQMIREAARNGCLALGNIYLDDRPIATQLTLLSGQTAYQYKMAYDESVHNDQDVRNLSIGALTILRLIEFLFESGKTERFDFGIGNEDYKATWCTSTREVWSITAFNSRSVRGMAAFLYDRARALAGMLRRHISRRKPIAMPSSSS